jgi:hypothetical protein
MGGEGGRPLPRGLRLKTSWVSQLPLEVADSTDRLLTAALNSDISDFSEPSDLGDHLQDKCYVIQSPLFLQVDEVTDISLPLQERQELKVRESGTLKLFLSDSRVSVIGVSKKRMALLSPTSLPGIKISLRPPVEMRYGVLFLDDEKFSLEGGHSPPLMEHREFVCNGRSNLPPRPPPGRPFSQQTGGFLTSDDEMEDDVIIIDSE